MEATLHQGELPLATGAHEHLFDTITNLTGDGLCLAEMITDAEGRAVDYRFLEVNPKFEAFTGLKDAEGKTALELVPGLEHHWVDTYGRVGLGRETLRFENGSVPMGRWFEVCASPAPVFGQLFILFRDVTRRKDAEEANLQALDRAQHLLSELNHRVKNSLTVINSIISMEKRKSSEDVGRALDRVGSRIDAVRGLFAALSDTGSVDRVCSGTYLNRVVDGLQGAVVIEGRIVIRAEIEEIELDAEQAVSLGLVVNELVTNAVKHAFPNGRHGTIDVKFCKDGDALVLCVTDDGGQAPAGAGTEGGLGSRLIKAFAQNLDADIETDASDRGTCVTLRFRPSGNP
ncbi:sensor histidine kinase [Maritimibacter dapengensis]|uniref:histidine kinase n=1 Tax=Maritimibacter dapengensis TaxID=2836868 RepID=A0ABS6T2Z6_9RHOB|nr:ATP-binding protein [Maritimibacter dapengensis]MBV7379626.1 ATP-binding protein [Maritimibacter dapengensis]